jgi:hypothetical protein
VPVGALNDDLRAACLAALDLSREDCRAFALERSWDASAQAFLRNILVASRGRTGTGQSQAVATPTRLSA